VTPKSGKSPPVNAPVLEGYWSFDRGSGPTVVDISPRGRNGTLVGRASRAPGKVGQGLMLDGVGDAMHLPNDSMFDAWEAFSIVTWVKLLAGAKSQWPTIIEKAAGGRPKHWHMPNLSFI
jgi:hypothetical protein